MKINAQPIRILIIDRQPGWRDEAEAVLARQLEFRVKVLGHYDYSPALAAIDGALPDLVILGCPSIGRDERALIHEVFEHRRHLLVLSTALRWADMRALFLAGADDVTDKTYDPSRLLALVQQAVENLSTRSSYEQVQEENAQ